MNKKTAACVALVIILSTSLAFADWIALDSEFSGNAVSLDLRSVSDLELAIDMRLMALHTNIVARNDSDFAVIELDDSGTTAEIGSPKLPVIRRLVQIPEGASVRVSATGRTQYYPIEELTGAREILPAQPGVEKLSGAAANAPLAYNAQVYESDSWFFSNLAEIGRIGRLRGHRVAWLSIMPVDYNPAQGLIKVVSDVQITLEFPGADWEATREVLSRNADPRTHAIAAGMAINGQAFGDKAPVYFAPASYLIIGAREFFDVPEMQELVAAKVSKGYRVEFYDETQFASADDVKALILDAYESWERPPSFVLLLGDTNIVPEAVGESSARPATDFRYQLMDADDPFPDLAVGRFPARTIGDVAILAAKTLQNEMADFDSSLWVKKATFMASVDNSHISEGTHNHVINTYMNDHGYDSTKLYYARGATTQQVRDAVNAGLSLLTYSGHGATTHWSDGPYFDQTDVANLNNAAFPFVSSYACVTGRFTEDESFAETWVLADNGAVAFWGSSLNSLWEEDDILERLVYDGFFRGGGPQRMIPWVSGMTDYGKIGFWGHYGGQGYSLRYLEMYNLMGDPEQMVFSEQPYEPDAHIWGSVTEDGVDISFEVAGAPYAMIGLSQSGGNLSCAWADNAGSGALNYRRAMTKGEQLLLTVTGHNLIPLSMTLTVGDELPDPPIADDDDDAMDDDPGDDDSDDDSGDDGSKDSGDDSSDSDSGGCCGG
jgi:Peptidase family C25/Propeptide_C25